MVFQCVARWMETGDIEKDGFSGRKRRERRDKVLLLARSPLRGKRSVVAGQ
jgi:hypothetical protein